MFCGCGGTTRVIDSRFNKDTIRRRRECLDCGERFTTHEQRQGEEEPFTIKDILDTGAKWAPIEQNRGGERFYVYFLIDPRNDRVFYVGKGSGGRIYEHERNVIAMRDGETPATIKRIREILECGERVCHYVASRFEYESDAYYYEERMIKKFSHPGLTNIRCNDFILENA